MFRDARAMDRQRTAASFDQALSRYSKTAESWFDGAVGSVDSRLAHCDRLLHSAKFTVARVDISDAQRYLAAANSLADDRRALEALRSDLLTGGSDYQETHVAGIPVSAAADLVDNSKMWNNFGELGVSHSLPPTPSHPAAPAATPAGNGHPWLSDLGHHGSHRSAKPQPPMMQNAIKPATVKPEVGGFDINTKLPKVKKPVMKGLPKTPVGGNPAPLPAPTKMGKGTHKYPRLKPEDIMVDDPEQQKSLSGFVNDALSSMETPSDPWRKEMQHRGLEWNWGRDAPPSVKRDQYGMVPNGYWNPQTGDFQPERRPEPYSLKQLTYPNHERDEYLDAVEKHRGPYYDTTGTSWDADSPYMKELTKWSDGHAPNLYDSDEYSAQLYAQRRAENPNEPMGQYEKRVAPRYKKRYRDEQINQAAEGDGPDDFAKLSGAERRWVTLESARFIAANANALDDLHELATRAHHHAQVATSTFTPARSAAVCRSFVAATVELGKKNAPKRGVRRQAASLDFDPQMLFL